MKQIFLIFTFLFSTFYASAQTVEWAKILGGSGNDYGQSIQQTTDGGYILFGISNSISNDLPQNNGGDDYGTMKIDKNGVKQWTRNYGGSDTDYGISVQQTTDGGYILLGGSKSEDKDFSQNNGFYDYGIIKIDKNGVKQWSKNFGGSGEDFGYSIQQTTDGGYILFGRSKSNNGDFSQNKGGIDYGVIKIDKNGVKQWSKNYGGFGNDEGQSIQQTTDGGYILFGTSNSNNGDFSQNNGDVDYGVIKIDKNGIKQWSKNYGGSDADIGSSIQQTTDGGYILLGRSFSNDVAFSQNNGGSDYGVIKIDKNGVKQWSKNYGGSGDDSGYSIQQTTDGSYILIGNSTSIDGDFSQNNGNVDCGVIKIDKNGVKLWSKNFGGSEYDYGTSVQQTTDGGYILFGNTNSNFIQNKGGQDFRVIKITDCIVTAPTLTTNKTKYCEGEDIILSINNAAQYSSQAKYDFTILNTSIAQQSTTTYTLKNAKANNSGKCSIVVNDNGCASTKIEIDLLVNPKPILNALPDATLSCSKSTDLSNGAATNSNFTYQWSALSGNLSSAANILNAATNTAGTYRLLVSDKNTTCSKEDTVVVKAASAVLVNAGADDVIACNVNYTLNQGKTPNLNYTYQWTSSNGGKIASGANTISAIVSKSGTYTILAKDKTSDCTATDEVIITATALPNLSAGNNYTLQCKGENYTLAQGITPIATYDYLWTSNNGNILSGNNTLNAVVNQAGTYTLVATDKASGCSASAQVSIGAVPIYTANAGNPQTVCDTKTKLSAQLPTNSTGEWSIVSGICTINDVKNPTTEIFALKQGTTVLKWTISKANCPNYVSAEVSINSENIKIQAVADLSTVPEGQLADTINVLANDKLNGIQNFTIALDKKPFTGVLTELNKGIFQYNFNPNDIGNAYFSYKICSDACKDSCSTANASITIKRKFNTDSGSQLPIIITPNGDGLNDNWTIDEIDKYPKNELFIYSRWGSLVWHGKLDQSGWGGNNQKGERLPDGTYYYVIQLDIAGGKTIFGDILVISD